MLKISKRVFLSVVFLFIVVLISAMVFLFGEASFITASTLLLVGFTLVLAAGAALQTSIILFTQKRE